MTIFRSTLPVHCYLAFLAGGLLLGACAPVPSTPSTGLERQLEQLQNQQEEQAKQLALIENQLNQLLQGESTTPVEPRQDQVSTQPMIPAAISQEVSTLADSASSYLAAFSNLAAGRFPEAEMGFNAFLGQYPDHQYAANARYWLASAQLSQGKLQTATSNLRQVILQNGDRASASLSLLAKTYRRQGMIAEAEEVLEQLRNRYPESSEARQLLQTSQP